MPLTKEQLRKKAQDYSESVDGAIEFAPVGDLPVTDQEVAMQKLNLFENGEEGGQR